MAARQIQGELDRCAGTTSKNREPAACAVQYDVGRNEIRIVVDSVGHDRPRHRGQHLANLAVVHAQHCKSVERKPMQKLEKRASQPLEISVERRHVIGIDVGDDCNDRMQQQKRGVALVASATRYSPAQPRVRTAAQKASPDDERRVESAGGKQAGHEARRGRLAVGARHRNAVTKPHQLGQHLSARKHRNMADASLRPPPGCSTRWLRTPRRPRHAQHDLDRDRCAP